MTIQKLIVAGIAGVVIFWTASAAAAEVIPGTPRWAFLIGINPNVGRAFWVKPQGSAPSGQGQWVLAGKGSRGWVVLDHSLIGYNSRWTEESIKQSVKIAEVELASMAEQEQAERLPAVETGVDPGAAVVPVIGFSRFAPTAITTTRTTVTTCSSHCSGGSCSGCPKQSGCTAPSSYCAASSCPAKATPVAPVAVAQQGNVGVAAPSVVPLRISAGAVGSRPIIVGRR